jgi:LmbE family N-acetylglucosaminyl deacetylase
MKNVLVVAAHPDDEVLGCGGTIARHVNNGDKVYIVFMTNGVGSRISTKEGDRIEREGFANRASKILGAEPPIFLNFPDNRMDSVELLDVVKSLEAVIKEICPEIIYTHYIDDLNIDHQITHRAMITACRPQPGFSVKKICIFEVLSSSDWSLGNSNSFSPNYYVNIESTINLKIKALKVYKSEIRDFPHSRSIESVKSQVTLRGSSVGLSAAEAFIVIREILD